MSDLPIPGFQHEDAIVDERVPVNQEAETEVTDALSRLGFLDPRHGVDVPWALMTIGNVTMLVNQMREECLSHEAMLFQKWSKRHELRIWQHRRIALEQVLKALASN